MQSLKDLEKESIVKGQYIRKRPTTAQLKAKKQGGTQA